VRILVTGISGQVGAAIVPRLAGLGEVIAADRSVLDLSRPREIAGILDELNPHLIVNPAAYTAVDRAEDERDLAFLVNAAAPQALAQWAANRDVPLVHFSTDYVFDGSGERPWREDDPVGPLSAYGASKLAGEDAIRGAAGPHLIVRTSWVYAASGVNFLRTIVRLARERDELRIVADQVGSPTSAASIAGALAEIFRAHCTDLSTAFAAANGLVHLTAGGETSWHGFAGAIVTGLKQRGVPVATRRVIPITTQEYPTKAVRPLNSRLDLSRLGRAFGIAPQGWQAPLEAELDQLAATAL
jgi:dTDP-4-dehydrorhamnose reductase